MKIHVPTLGKDVRISFQYFNNFKEIHAKIGEVNPDLATNDPDTGRIIDGFDKIHSGYVTLYYKDQNNKVVGRKNALIRTLAIANYPYEVRQEIWEGLKAKGFRIDPKKRR